MPPITLFPLPETPTSSFIRRIPIGAEVQPSGVVHFRLWAPKANEVAVVLVRDAGDERIPLEREPNGYFSGAVQDASAGLRYRFQLDGGTYPDPASRFQPEGPHGPSEVVDPSSFVWTDADWAGTGPDGQILYEMHLGTFTREGTWQAAIQKLPHLVELGITVIEVMPVAEFPGKFGWGYDGVNFFAPTHLYGAPDDFRAFVDAAHAAGIGVILDVVYNHFGPDGCYLREFSPNYFSSIYHNEWGDPLNFDGEGSAAVREYFIENAGYWISEYHLDGLRLDATQQIFDSSATHILKDVSDRVRAAANGRKTYLVAENETQHSRLVRPSEKNGLALDALWNDDFHHSAIVALTGRKEAYYTDYLGTPQEFISMVKYGYLYQGQRYKWQDHRRGTPSLDLAPEKFVTFLENHDQVANSLHGKRLRDLSNPAALRAMTALLLLGPNTPMLFQGQEFGSTAPFLYFADHHPELASMVATGRRTFLEQFPSIAALKIEAKQLIAAPEKEETFLRSKLDYGERDINAHIFELHRDLIALRRSDPVFADVTRGAIDGAVLSTQSFVLRFFGGEHGDRLLLINLGIDIHLDSEPEPLLAPQEGCDWAVIWSSEAPRYGGSGESVIASDDSWNLPGNTALVLASHISTHHAPDEHST